MEWRLFGNIRETADEGSVAVTLPSGATAEDAVAALLDARPELRARVLDGDGELESHVNVLLNGETLPKSEFDRTVESDDEMALLPPVSGG